MKDATQTIIMGAEEARREWRNVVDTVLAGEDVIVERYSRPTVAVIAYDDYAAIRHELEELRAARRTHQLRVAWQQGKIKHLPWATSASGNEKE
jgi:prevent-host-death family protein